MNDFDYEVDKSVLLSKSNFSAYIENMVLENKGMTYFDAILKFSYDSDKDPDELLQFMSPVLLEKIKKAAIDMDLFRQDSYALDELL